MPGRRDPGGEEHSGERDLYEISTWEVRTITDKIAVTFVKYLRTHGLTALILLAAGIFLAELGLILYVITERPVAAVLTGLSIFPAFVIAGYIWISDPTLKEPLEPIAVTFILAILFASFAAMTNAFFNNPVGSIPLVGLVLFYFLVVAPGEEFVKWLSVRVFAYRRPTFQSVADGAVYGAVAGLGFATIENSLYISSTLLRIQPVEAAPVIALNSAVGRSFVGPGHVIFSSFAGYYLGLAKFNQEHAFPIILKGLLIAAILHGIYNTAVTYLSTRFVTIAFILVFDGIILYILLRKLARYQRFYEEAIDSSKPSTATSG